MWGFEIGNLAGDDISLGSVDDGCISGGHVVVDASSAIDGGLNDDIQYDHVAAVNYNIDHYTSTRPDA